MDLKQPNEDNNEFIKDKNKVNPHNAIRSNYQTLPQLPAVLPENPDFSCPNNTLQSHESSHKKSNQQSDYYRRVMDEAQQHNRRVVDIKADNDSGKTYNFGQKKHSSDARIAEANNWLFSSNNNDNMASGRSSINTSKQFRLKQNLHVIPSSPPQDQYTTTLTGFKDPAAHFNLNDKWR